jgi:hypothetical protein
MNVSRSVLTLATLLVALAPASASADAWLPPPGDRYAEFRASHFGSGDFFDSSGVRRFFPGRGIFEARQLLAYNEIGWKERLSLVIALPARSVTLRSDALNTTRTATGLSDLILGARFRILSGATALSAQVEWKAPLGYQHVSAPSLGSGQQDVSGRLNFGMSLPSIDGFFEVLGGYRYRFETPVDEIEVGADVGFWVKSLVLVEGRYAGFKSMGADDAALDRQAHQVGPRLTVRIDDGLDVFAGSSHVIDGNNVEKSDEYYAGLAFKRTRLNRLQGYLGGKRRP